MSLQGAIRTATEGLQIVARQAAVASRNVTNAATPDYTVKRVAVESLPEGGVRIGDTTRQVDAFLRAEARSVRGQSAHAEVRERAVVPLVALNGSPGSADSIGELMAALRDELTGLRARPADVTEQGNTLRAAGNLAERLNELAWGVARARQSAQDELARQVAAANGLVQQIARLDDEIQSTRASGSPDAYALDRRDAAIQQLSELLEVTPTPGARDQVTLILRGGHTLPLDPEKAPFSIAAATVTPDSFYRPPTDTLPAGTLPPLMLGEIDITSVTRNGKLGALIELRDSTLPRMQAELDVLASTLATRFDAQGLRLFADGANPTAGPPNVTASTGYSGAVVGFAARITLSSAVIAEPRLLRDGTHNATATGFVPNTASGPSGFTALLDNLLNYTFGAAAGPSGAPHPTLPARNLGPAGDLVSSFNPPARLTDHAAAMTGAHAIMAGEATTRLTEASASRTRIDLLLQQREGVDVDREMADLLQLQNAYAANARILAAVQEMWDALLRSAR
jgi:flagellar hook-associated protein 1 FlgK